MQSSRVVVLVVALAVLLASPALSDVIQSVADEYQIPDGSNNNLKHGFGITPNPYLREDKVPNSYEDQVGLMRTTPPARFVSNTLFPFVTKNALGPRNLNAFHTAMAQFLAHDLLMSGPPASNVGGGEPFAIPVPKDDPFFDPFGEGNKTIGFARNPIDAATGQTTPRVFYNLKTPFIDGGHIYGASLERQEALRNKTHPEYLGTVRVANGEIFPIFNTEGVGNGGGSDNTNLFLVGDERGNLHPTLLAYHVLFVREHNRIVDEMKKTKGFKDLSAEKLFYEARRRVIAYFQNIVFNEYMPATTGTPLPEYTGYDADTYPLISLSFVSSAFRYGHPELSTSFIPMLDGEVAGVPILIRDVIFRPELYSQDGIDVFIRGALASRQQRVRNAFVDDLRNFLFGFPGQGGTDLASLNIQRSRDFGIPFYNDARRAYGLDPVRRYEDVISDPTILAAVKSIYGTNPDFGETYVIGLAEDHQEESNLGPLFTAIITNQYRRIRDGDRFFFESKDAGFTDEEIAFIKTQTIADIILRNTEIYEVPCSAFFASTNRDCTKPRPVDNSTGAIGNSTNTATFFGGDVIVNWDIDSDRSEIIITLTAQTSGWIGFAFARNPGNMLNADAIISSGSGSNVRSVDYNIYGQRREGCPGVCPDTQQGGSDDVLESFGSDEGGVTRVTFRRKLDTGDDTDVAVVDDGEPTAILIAYGSSDAIGYHGGNKVAAEINFFTGEFETTSTSSGPRDRLTVHGVLMVVTWLFIAPLGIFIVKFCKRLLLRWWFRLHMITQYIGTLLMICALILAVEAVAAEGRKHIRNAHAILGIITISLGIVVPALGQLTSLVWTPTRKYAVFPDWTHYILGYGATIFSCVTIFFGIWERTHNDDKYWWWYFLVALWIVIVVILYIICWIILIIYNIVDAKNRKEQGEEAGEDGGEDKKDEQWSSAEDSD